MNDDQTRMHARRRAGAKLGFYIHFTVYVLVNLLLVAINLMTTPGRLWFLWALGGWGIGVFCHAAAVFVAPKLLNQMTEHELQVKADQK